MGVVIAILLLCLVLAIPQAADMLFGLIGLAFALLVFVLGAGLLLGVGAVIVAALMA